MHLHLKVATVRLWGSDADMCAMIRRKNIYVGYWKRGIAVIDACWTPADRGHYTAGASGVIPLDKGPVRLLFVNPPDAHMVGVVDPARSTLRINGKEYTAAPIFPCTVDLHTIGCW